jgi:hypothetical protein
MVMEETLENALHRVIPSGAEADPPTSTTALAATAMVRPQRHKTIH